jgi:hypothetical protein
MCLRSALPDLMCPVPLSKLVLDFPPLIDTAPVPALPSSPTSPASYSSPSLVLLPLLRHHPSFPSFLTSLQRMCYNPTKLHTLAPPPSTTTLYLQKHPQRPHIPMSNIVRPKGTQSGLWHQGLRLRSLARLLRLLMKRWWAHI